MLTKQFVAATAVMPFTTSLGVVCHHAITDFKSFDAGSECCDYTDGFIVGHKGEL